MPLFCPNCKEEVRREMQFCPACGVTLDFTPQPSTDRFERDLQKRDILGYVSVGVILIIMAITYIRYPLQLAQIIEYFKGMADQGAFIKPPSLFLEATIFFLYSTGVWGLVLAALRLFIYKKIGNAVGNFLGGVFAFFCAYMVTNYSTGIFTERVVLSSFVIATGSLIIVNALILFAEKKHDLTI